MDFELRPYQKEAEERISAEWDSGHRKTLLILPTGCGKTVVFSRVAEGQVNRGGRVLIMAHRGELLDQAADKIGRITGLQCAYEKAGATALGSFLPITVASVQSICQEKRLQSFPKDYYSTIIVDEAHHCLSDSYQRVLDYFPAANVLGVTATPDRGDRKNLGNYFNSIAYEYTMSQAIRDGYLCKIRAQMIPLRLDISGVGVSGGDYNAGEIGSALEPYLQQIAAEIAEHYAHRKIVIFLPLVRTSQKFCAILREAGIQAAEVNGNSADRAEILRDFEAGKYTALCNSMLLTEGWDCPSVDCVVMLRPTKIRSLYQQAIGRGTRLCPGKTELLILDFLWMTERHDLCHPSSLIAKNEEIAKRIDQMVMDLGDGVCIDEAEEKAERDIIREREAALAKQLEEMRKRDRRLINPIDFALSLEMEDIVNYEPTFAWEVAPATPKQIETLKNLGIDASAVQGKGMASMLLDRLFTRRKEGLCTPKQIQFLRRKGFQHVSAWTKAEASGIMDQIAKNSWRVPIEIDPHTWQPERLAEPVLKRSYVKGVF